MKKVCATTVQVGDVVVFNEGAATEVAAIETSTYFTKFKAAADFVAGTVTEFWVAKGDAVTVVVA